MRPLRLTLALLAAFTAHTLAAPIDVTKGFAGATWGMSPAEVAKATGAVDAGFVRRYPSIPTIVLVKQAENNQLVTFYVFHLDKLVEIVRGSNLDNFNIAPQNLVTSSFTSDGSIRISAAGQFPSFNPAGDLKAFNQISYNLVFELLCKPVEKSVNDAWMAENEAQFRAHTLPKLLE